MINFYINIVKFRYCNRASVFKNMSKDEIWTATKPLESTFLYPTDEEAPKGFAWNASDVIC